MSRPRMTLVSRHLLEPKEFAADIASRDCIYAFRFREGEPIDVSWLRMYFAHQGKHIDVALYWITKTGATYYIGKLTLPNDQQPPTTD